MNLSTLSGRARRGLAEVGALARRATGPRVTWRDENLLEIDGQRFRLAARWEEWFEVPESTAELFVLVKPHHMVEEYLGRFRADRPRTIVEVGVFQGGGAAFLWQLCRPERLVGFDFAAGPGPALVEFKAQHQADGLRMHWGTNQGDVPTLLDTIAVDLGDRPLDLVIDDASHTYDYTRTTFQALFPLVRPGGTYIVEDWGWAHWRGAPWQVDGGPFGDGEPALTNLIFELVMASASSPEHVARVDVFHHHAVITRGPAPVGPPIVLSDLYEARGREFKQEL